MKQELECKHKGKNVFGEKCTGYVEFTYGELCEGCHNYTIKNGTPEKP